MKEIVKKIKSALDQAVTSSQSMQCELELKYQIINSDYGGKALKEKLRNAGVTNKQEIDTIAQFLSKTIHLESVTLRMLEKYGKLDVNTYLSDVMECGQALSHRLQKEDPNAYNVVQREFAVVANGNKIGTTNLQQCVM